MAQRPSNKISGEKISVSKKGALIAAWAGTVTVLAVIILWLQLSYGPDPVITENHTSAPGPATETAGSPGAAEGETQTVSVAQKDSPPPQVAPAPQETAQAAEQTSPPRQLAGLDPALVENGPYGPIPKRAADGREPWRTYAAPFTPGVDTPLISIVIVGLGLNHNVTQTAIDSLPPAVTLAFSPYGRDLESWVAKARSAGHEVLVMLPTEPLDYPTNDPGPHTLLTSLPTEDNLDRLYYVLSRFQGYVGLVNDMGSKYTASAEAIRPLMEELRDRGLLFLDSRTTRYTVGAQQARTVGTARAINNRYIDNQAIAGEIDQHLTDLQTTAEGLGVAVGIGRPYPVTFERIAAFAERLQGSNVRLAPVTAVANKQAIQ